MRILKKLKYLFRDYFAFTRSETKGVIILLVLIILFLFALPVYQHFYRKHYSPENYGQDQALLDSVMVQIEQKFQIRENNEARKVSSTIAVIHSFDPNVTDANTLTALGFRPWIAERIINYRKAGGKFEKKDDLLQIYGISEETYQKVYHYIDLPENAPVITTVNHFSKPVEEKIVEKNSEEAKININMADTIQLKRLPGIGAVLAARIIKYRDLLGGFVDTAQFAEIYGLSPEVVANLQTQSVITNVEIVQKINLNTADVKILAAHPYISFKVAKAIVKHRENFGAYSKIEDVKEVYLVDEDLFAKIGRYLVI